MSDFIPNYDGDCEVAASFGPPPNILLPVITFDDARFVEISDKSNLVIAYRRFYGRNVELIPVLDLHGSVFVSRIGAERSLGFANGESNVVATWSEAVVHIEDWLWSNHDDVNPFNLLDIVETVNLSWPPMDYILGRCRAHIQRYSKERAEAWTALEYGKRGLKLPPNVRLPLSSTRWRKGSIEWAVLELTVRTVPRLFDDLERLERTGYDDTACSAVKYSLGCVGIHRAAGM